MLRFATRFILLGIFLTTFAMAQNGQMRGKVSDKDTGEPLIGANISLEGTTMGAATDGDGIFVITNIPAGTYTVILSYIGYDDQVVSGVSVTSGGSATVNATLSATGIAMNPITISASRRPEKTLEAPASVTVIDEAQIRSEVVTSSAEILKNTTGVDMATTGIDRREMVLRGFNNAFSGAAYVLTDYRQAAVPSLAVNIHSIMPNMAIDVAKVEVVRGPGSALYGPGVDAGVVHFITRDPFTDQGLDVSLAAGERSSAFGSFRFAHALSDQFAFKVTGQVAQANDWEMDRNDPDDFLQIATINRDAAGMPIDTVFQDRNSDFSKQNINAMFQVRPADNVALTFNGGFSALNGTVLTGIGTVQAIDFGYSYLQGRLQAGRFFSQIYYNRNNAGDSFVYGTGQEVVDNSSQLNVQAQYDLSFMDDKQNFIIGGDFERTNPDTDGTIYGRNEQDDEIYESGGYIQSLTRLGSMVDLTLAARADYNNVIDEVQVSPRFALVLKANATNSFRATYNRAFSAPGNNSLFLDIVAGQIPNSDILVRGRGAKDGYTFRRNAAYTALAGTDLIARSLNPAALGAETPVGVSHGPVYGSVYAGLAALPTSVLQQQLAAAGFPTLPEPTIAFLVDQLSPANTMVNGFTAGNLAALNPTTGEFSPVSDVVNVSPLEQTITQTMEAGYKGLIGGKMIVAVDGYFTTKENFIGPLLTETPFVLNDGPAFASEFVSSVAAAINLNPTLAGALQQAGITPQQVAGLIYSFAAPSLPDGQPLALVVPQENDLGAGATPEVMLTYRNFGKVSFYGIDLSAQYFVNDELSIFGNFSMVSDDFFDNEELDETNTDLAVALNAPKLKVKGGFNYTQPKGVAFGLSGRFVQGFPVQSCPYVGGRPAPFNDSNSGVEDYFLLDATIGYDLENYAKGVRFDITAQNLLDNTHREFIGAPQVGRLVLARLSFGLR